MLAALAFALVLGGSTQEPTTSKVDTASILDQLIERSRGITSFTATYQVSRSDEKDAMTMRLDYRAPDALRMDLEDGESRMSCWAIGDSLDMRGQHDGQAIGWHVDMAAIRDELRPIESALARAFPAALPAAGSPGAVVHALWAFDAQTNKNNWDISIATLDHVETPLGWLKTLKTKSAELDDDGKRLRCSTDDGRFDVVISKATGFLERLFSHKPDSDSTMTIELESLALDEPVDGSRFDVPTGNVDQRSSAEQVKLMEHALRAGLRERIWAQVANECGSAEVDSELRDKFEATLRPLQELMCHAQYDDWVARRREHLGQVAEYVRQKDEAGSSDDELDEIRDKYRSALVDALDKAFDPNRLRFEIPARATTASCAPQLRSIENELAQSVLRDLVRQPLLDEFDRVTKTD